MQTVINSTIGMKVLLSSSHLDGHFLRFRLKKYGPVNLNWLHDDIMPNHVYFLKWINIAGSRFLRWIKRWCWHENVILLLFCFPHLSFLLIKIGVREWLLNEKFTAFYFPLWFTFIRTVLVKTRFFFNLKGQIKGILALRLNGNPCIFLCSVKWKAKKDGERRRISVSGHYWLVPVGYS